MDRRSFLSRAGAAVAASGFMNGSMAAGGAGGAGGLEQEFAAFALSLKYEELPKEVVDAAKRVLIDTLGCALGAVGTEAASIAVKTVGKTFGKGKTASVIGYPRQETIEGAIFVNGVLVRSLDLNDTYIGTDPLHPSEVLPTALALCEERGRSGRELIEAIVAGYEASMRVNDAISFMERGFHPLCAMSFGVPLIAGKAWRLSKDEIANAVGVSAARGFTSFVVNSGAISMMKAMGLAMTAVDGVFAARLAAQGFTGPSGNLEYMASRMKPAKPDFAIDLETTRYRLPRVSFKRFPIQIELQAVAEAGSTLHAQLKGRAKDIRAITVETYPGVIERVADPAKFTPETKGTADHSLPVCLAMALLEGDVTVAQFEKDRWRGEDVKALVKKTTVKPGEALIAKRPKGRGASVEVTLEDGQSFRETVEVAEGDAERPLSRPSLERKFINFAVPVLGAAKARQILSMIDSLETMKDTRKLARALAGPGKQNLA